MGPVVLILREGMPITLQSFVVLFIAIGLGWRIGVLSVLGYILAGILGLPVFAGYRSGPEVLSGPHAGFFLGFILASWLCGTISEKTGFSKAGYILLNWLIGHAVILLVGVLWMWHLQIENLADKILGILPGAGIKSLFGAVFIILIHKLIKEKTRKNPE